ncbi:MAG: DMT family transporter [Paracoccaceae bacterium]
MTALEPPVHRNAAGAVSMLAAMAVIGLVDNAVAMIARDMGLWQFQLMRAVLSAPLLFLAARLLRQSLWPVAMGAVLMRSAAVMVAMALYFSALALMPIEQALAGLFTSPIWVLLISALWLRRRVGPWRVGAVALGFAGLLVVLEPDPQSLSPVILLPVAGGFFYALGMIATGTICAKESAATLLGWILLAQFVASAVMLVVLTSWLPGGEGFLARGWTWDIGRAMPWLSLQSVGALVGVALIIRAYQMGEASHIAIFEYAAFISGPFFAWVLFGQGIGLQQVLGIAMIATAGSAIALRLR